MDPSKLTGRVVTVVGLVSKPELNGQIAICNSFNEESQRFVVHILSDPNQENPPLTVSIKRANFELFSAPFEELCPSFYRVPDSFPEQIWPHSILDFTRSTEHISCMPGPALVLRNNCSFRGDRSAAGGGTTVSKYVRVVAMTQIDAMEFEDMIFTHAGVRAAVDCDKGKHTIFRRCKFQNVTDAVSVGNPGTKVIFESCSFERCAKSGVEVSNGAEVVLVDCTIRSAQRGVEIYRGGSATLLHCTILACGTGVSVYNKAQSLYMKNSLVDDCQESAAHISAGGKMHIRNCKLSNCKDSGIIVEGPKLSTVLVRDTVVRSCETGVMIRLGRSDTVLESCRVEDNGSGIRVEMNAVGTVGVNQSIVQNSRNLDFNNQGGTNYTFTRNGEVEPLNEMFARMIDDNPTMRACMAQALLREELEEQRTGSALAKPAEVARAAAMAGIMSVRCAACDREELPDETFQLCSACRDYHYCSKACQVRNAYWDTPVDILASILLLQIFRKSTGKNTRNTASNGIRLRRK